MQNARIEPEESRKIVARLMKKYKLSENMKDKNPINLPLSVELQRGVVGIVKKNSETPFSDNTNKSNNTNNNNNINNSKSQLNKTEVKHDI